MIQAKENPRYEYLMSIVNIMPDSPGVYRYFDAEGTIIYVGKAKNLKRRVQSYFTKEHESRRTANLVRQIHDLKYIVVNTENDALNLENRMIKMHQPKYNVLLKDGKTYPWICVRNEAFPRVFLTRTVVKDGSNYFGPYTNLGVAKTLIDLFERIYKVRTCSLNLQPQMIEKGYKVCLKYHIKKCSAPCIGKVSRETYQEEIEEIKQILRGHTAELIRSLYDNMTAKAEEMKFEEAAAIKGKIEIIEGYRTRNNIVPTSISNVDVYAYDEEETNAIVSYFHIVQGAIIQSYTIEYKKNIDEDRADILALGIEEMRERFANSQEETKENSCKEIIAPFEPSMLPEGVIATIPQRGDKRKLLELAEKNCKQYRIDQIKQAEKLNPEQRNTRLLSEIQKQLGLKKLPMHIESFDNSNISGTDAVASCVVFIGGKPDKKQYRKFNIKTVIGSDDYASMHEVVLRRYRRLLDEKQALPDLIIADGGIGQMGVIRNALDELNIEIPVGGLVKDGRHRTRQLLFGNPPQAVDIKVGSNLFHLLERIQEEVHRFAITFHRDKRSKSQTKSELDEISGIGPKTRQELIKSFKSVKRIREVSLDELASVIGISKAKKIKSHFGNQGNNV